MTLLILKNSECFHVCVFNIECTSKEIDVVKISRSVTKCDSPKWSCGRKFIIEKKKELRMLYMIIQ